MTESIVATLNVAFTDDDGLGDNAGANKIILQQMTQRFDYKGRLWARCFPSSGVQFIASAGRVEGGETRVQIFRESLKFSNSSKVSLGFPGAFNVSVAHSVLMRKTKDTYGNFTIQPAYVNLHYDSEQCAIIATSQGVEVPIYGGCSITYTASYQMLYYTPRIYAPFNGAYGVAYTMGDIYGYNNYTVEILELELNISSSPQWVEYARVTSKIVLDAKGMWEFPPNWESTDTANKGKTGDERQDYPAPGRFPGFAAEIDQDNSFVDVRIHEIIEVNTIGSLRYIAQNGDRIYAPYWGASDSYYPVYEVKFADPPGGAKANSADAFQHELQNYTWHDVFLDVDKTEVLRDLQVDYPGVTEE